MMSAQRSSHLLDVRRGILIGSGQFFPCLGVRLGPPPYVVCGENLEIWHVVAIITKLRSPLGSVHELVRDCSINVRASNKVCYS
jgi:hypothetical protein